MDRPITVHYGSTPLTFPPVFILIPRLKFTVDSIAAKVAHPQVKMKKVKIKRVKTDSPTTEQKGSKLSFNNANKGYKSSQKVIDKPKRPRGRPRKKIPHLELRVSLVRLDDLYKHLPLTTGRKCPSTPKAVQKKRRKKKRKIDSDVEYFSRNKDSSSEDEKVSSNSHALKNLFINRVGMSLKEWESDNSKNDGNLKCEQTGFGNPIILVRFYHTKMT